MPAASLSVDIEAPADLVMEVITDFRAYPAFIDEMHAVEVLREEGAAWEVRFTIDVVRRLVYTLKLERLDDLHLDWSLVEGAFRSNDGGWTLESVDDGRKTRATYRIDIQVGMFVPGNIIRSLIERSLPRTVQAFKTESERRARGGSARSGG